jgi:hypothetical protein
VKALALKRHEFTRHGYRRLCKPLVLTIAFLAADMVAGQHRAQTERIQTKMACGSGQVALWAARDGVRVTVQPPTTGVGTRFRALTYYVALTSRGVGGIGGLPFDLGL